ncbi:MAG: hypothetical protein BWX91_01639 [Spirochaetes bacterium ADurb.Bin133]|jgi:hypothetical protein|nr:MAG: hypothetical protein BWX91_01639 [Spirochaetes bacterium ADurb.Bin133]
MKNILLALLILLRAQSLFSTENFILRKCALLNPKNSQNVSTYNIIKNETIKILETQTYLKKINYFDINRLKKNIDLIKDLDNLNNLKLFYIKTDVDSLIILDVIEERDHYTVDVNIVDIINNLDYIRSYNVSKRYFYDDLNKFAEFIRNITEDDFKPVEFNELKRKKKNQKIVLRNNPLYNLSLSAGLGVTSGNASDSESQIIFTGPNVYINIDTKLKSFYMGALFEWTPLFNEPLDRFTSNENDKNKIFLNNFFGSASFGGLFFVETFLFGGGAAFSYQNIYSQIQKNSSGLSEFNVKNFNLLFFYLKFSFIPIKEAIISLDVGSFFSITDIKNIIPSTFFPLYLNFTFSYVFYKNIFFEVRIPSYLIQVNNSQNYSKIYMKFILDIGLGFKIEWYKK